MGLPVAVAVGADAGGARARLAVLAPETVGRLGVDETCVILSETLPCWNRGLEMLTIGVDEGDDVEVVLAEEGPHKGIIVVVASRQLQGDVLNNLAESTRQLPFRL